MDQTKAEAALLTMDQAALAVDRVDEYSDEVEDPTMAYALANFGNLTYHHLRSLHNSFQFLFHITCPSPDCPWIDDTTSNQSTS